MRSMVGREGQQLRDAEASSQRRAATTMLTFLGAASSIATFVVFPLWVAFTVCAVVSWSGIVAFFRVRLLTSLSVGLVLVVVVPFVTIGVREVFRSDPYRGAFIVRGASPVVIGSIAPQEDTEGSMNVNWAPGDTVTVECVTEDLERSSRHWYRVSGKPKVFLFETQLMPSVAEPPGNPPDC